MYTIIQLFLDCTIGAGFYIKFGKKNYFPIDNNKEVSFVVFMFNRLFIDSFHVVQ